MPHRMQLLHSLQQHPAFAASQVLAGCHYSTVCSSTQPSLLHRFLQDATTPQSAAAPSLICYTGSCRLPHRMELLHSLQQHPVSAAPQVLAWWHKVWNYQVATQDATTPQSATAPSPCNIFNMNQCVCERWGWNECPFSHFCKFSKMWLHSFLRKTFKNFRFANSEDFCAYSLFAKKIRKFTCWWQFLMFWLRF